jgi:hypothetical protein
VAPEVLGEVLAPDAQVERAISLDPARTRPRFYQSVSEACKALADAWVHDDERYHLDRAKVRTTRRHRLPLGRQPHT